MGHRLLLGLSGAYRSGGKTVVIESLGKICSLAALRQPPEEIVILRASQGLAVSPRFECFFFPKHHRSVYERISGPEAAVDVGG